MSMWWQSWYKRIWIKRTYYQDLAREMQIIWKKKPLVLGASGIKLKGLRKQLRKIDIVTQTK